MNLTKRAQKVIIVITAKKKPIITVYLVIKAIEVIKVFEAIKVKKATQAPKIIKTVTIKL